MNKQKKIRAKTINSDNEDDDQSVQIIRKPNSFNSSTSLHSIKDQNKLNEMRNNSDIMRPASPHKISPEIKNKEVNSNESKESLLFYKRIKPNKMLRILSDDDDDVLAIPSQPIALSQIEEEIQFKQDTKPESPIKNAVLKSLEEHFKKGLDRLILFSKEVEGKKELIEEITNIIKNCENYFDILMTETQNNENLVMDTVNHDVGKYIHMLIKMMEENNQFVKNLRFLNSTISKLHKMEDDLKKKLINKFFDFEDIINKLGNEFNSDSQLFNNMMKKNQTEENNFLSGFTSEISKSDKSCSPMKIEPEENEYSISSEYSSKLRSKKRYKFPVIPEHIITKRITKTKGNIKETPTSQKRSVAKEITNPKLRKKVCIKIFNLLTRYCNVSNNEAPKLSMMLESKIRTKYPEMKEEYIKSSMTLLRNIKKGELDLEMLRSVENVSLDNLDRQVSNKID